MYRIICIFAFMCVPMLRADYAWSRCTLRPMTYDTTVEVLGCDSSNQETCEIEGGLNAGIRFSFKLNTTQTELTMEVHHVNSSLYESIKICELPHDKYYLTCPLLPSKRYSLMQQFHIPKTDKPINATLNLRLVTEEPAVVDCIRVPIKIKPEEKK